MLTQVMFAAAFLALAFVVLPLARVRRAVFALAHWGAHLAALTAVAACGVFFFWPAIAPPFATTVARPLSGFLMETAGLAEPQWAWLALATIAALTSLPVLTVIDFTRRLSRATAKDDRQVRHKKKRAARLSGNAAAVRPAAEPAEEPVTLAHGESGRRPRRTVLECLR